MQETGQIHGIKNGADAPAGDDKLLTSIVTGVLCETVRSSLY